MKIICTVILTNSYVPITIDSNGAKDTHNALLKAFTEKQPVIFGSVGWELWFIDGAKILAWYFHEPYMTNEKLVKAQEKIANALDGGVQQGESWKQ